MTLPAVDLVDFPSRADRIRYLNDRFGRLLEGRVLDVGCDVRTLARLRPDLDYLGIDAGGEPDLTVDLESGPLPFADASFDVVVCSDVLEHLDNLHRTFAELARVARRRLIVSLPNCWAAARRPLHRGKGKIGHYGLPGEPPTDRHKWFFSLAEGRTFLESAAERHALRVAEMRASEKVRPALVRWARRLRHPRREPYLNLYAHTLWAVLEKEA
jgi:SAM-dependent methyltransferase